MDVFILLISFGIIVYSGMSFYAIYSSNDYLYKGKTLGSILFFLLGFSSFLVGGLAIRQGADQLLNESNSFWLIFAVILLASSAIWWLINKEDFWKQ